MTPEGQYVFLEVNEAGQFPLIEEYTGMPLLEAFCDFLIAADPEFKYGGQKMDALRFMELDAHLEELTSAAAERHVPAVFPDYDESQEEAVGQPL